MVDLIDKEVLKKFNIDIIYVKLQCKKCKKIWGSTIYYNQIDPKELICRDCAQAKMLEQIYQS
jgi:hypothetical protein